MYPIHILSFWLSLISTPSRLIPYLGYQRHNVLRRRPDQSLMGVQERDTTGNTESEYVVAVAIPTVICSISDVYCAV